MTNPFTKLRSVRGRRRGSNTATDPEAASAAPGYHVQLSVPPEDGGEPASVGFTLGELLEIDTLDELLERAAAKPARNEALANPDSFKGRPIGDYLKALGVPEDTSRYEDEEGVTTINFNLGRILRRERERE